MKNRAFTTAELERARQALALLKSQKARGLTGLTGLQRMEVKAPFAVLQPVSSNHRKIFKAKNDVDKRYRYGQENGDEGVRKMLPSKHFDQVFGEEKINFREQPMSFDTKKTIAERNVSTAKPTNNEFLDIEIIECQYCNRKFNPESLAKHSRVCEKRPDRPKRKQFDSSKARAIEGVTVQEKDVQILKKEKKVPLWKTQSEYFRRAVGAKSKAKAEECTITEEVKPPDYVKCETCGRSFNSEAGKRHIPFCANRLKMEKLKNPHKFKNNKKN